MGGWKIKMTLFLDDNPIGWFYRVDIYFSLHPCLDQEKLWLTELSFEGKALKLFKWQNNHEPLLNWDNFKNSVIKKYGFTKKVLIMQQFLYSQRGSVAYYREEFEMMASIIGNIPKRILELNFICGLWPEIQMKVGLFNLIRLKAIMKWHGSLKMKFPPSNNWKNQQVIK